MSESIQYTEEDEYEYDPDNSVDTTTENYDRFVREVQKTMDLIGIHDIRWKCQIGDAGNNYARYSYSLSGRTLGITLTEDNLPEMGREFVLINSAEHEVIEGALLGDLLALAESRNHDPEQIEAATHRIVFLIQNLIDKVKQNEGK